jgi:hypothetical protein
MHIMRRKTPAPLAVDASNRARLWETGERMLDAWLPARPRE